MLELLAAVALSLPAIGFLFGSCSRCCCAILFTDTFTRANSTNLGSDWDEVAGDWSISSNTLTTSDDNAVALHSTTYDSTIAGWGFYGIVSLPYPTPLSEASFTNKVRIIFGYIDADNYHYVEFDYTWNSIITAGVTSIYSRVAAAETLLAKTDWTAGGLGPSSGFAPPTEFYLCLNDEIVTLYIGYDGLGGAPTSDLMTIDYTPGATATKFGFGTGSTVRSTGVGSFDSVNIITNRDFDDGLDTADQTICRCSRQCARECDDGAPYREEYSIDIDSFSCGEGVYDPTAISGTYVLSPKSIYVRTSIYYQRFDSCEWSYLESGSPIILMELTLVSGVWTLVITLPFLCVDGGGFPLGNSWTYTSDPQEECKATDPITLTLTSETGTCNCTVEPPAEIILSRA